LLNLVLLIREEEYGMVTERDGPLVGLPVYHSASNLAGAALTGTGATMTLLRAKMIRDMQWQRLAPKMALGSTTTGILFLLEREITNSARYLPSPEWHIFLQLSVYIQREQVLRGGLIPICVS